MDYSCILHLSYPHDHAQMENAEKKLNLKKFIWLGIFICQFLQLSTEYILCIELREGLI